MPNKVRVHELAKELGLTNEQMIKTLQKEGITVTSHLAGVDPDLAEIIREQCRAAAALTAEPVGVDDEEVIAPGILKAKARERKKLGKVEGEKVAKVRTVRTLGAAEEAEVPVPPPPPPVVPVVVVAPVAPPPPPVAPVAPAAPVAKAPAPLPAAVAAVAAVAPSEPAGAPREIHLKTPLIVKDLAGMLGLKPNELIQELMAHNLLVSINQTLEKKVAEEICVRHGCVLVSEKREKALLAGRPESVAEPEQLVYADAAVEPRPPVVTVLGHVDHGKTSLLDRIRNTHVTDSESGGITQHIGASTVPWKTTMITFIDTPGHEAFTAMRARGANVTDMAVLVVAADDGFMPQTVEALSHARAAKVPIIVVANKMDLPTANPDRLLVQMQQNELQPEEWGGQTALLRVSATTGLGVPELLDRILLECEMLELKANPKLPAQAVVLESQLEQGLGPTVSVLVKNGTLHVGDAILCGRDSGKVRALVDCRNHRVDAAGPSMPVKVVGLDGLPESGSVMVACPDERECRRIADARRMERRQTSLQSVPKVTLEDLFRQVEENARKELRIVLKTDVQGTAEAVTTSLAKIGGDRIHCEAVYTGVGGITDNDVLLASASDALVIGFRVRVNPGVNAIAKREGVEIRLYSVIYELLEQIKEAMEGLLEPERREVKLGQAKILQVFALTKRGKICGCSVLSGLIRVKAKVRVYRKEELIYNGSVVSLRRFQDDVKEVKSGMECGVGLDNFNDFEVDDLLDVYDYTEVPVKL